MGPSKNRRGVGSVCECVCVCAHMGVEDRDGGECNRPNHSFLLTDAGPRGESWERKGGGQGCWPIEFSWGLLGSGDTEGAE